MIAYRLDDLGWFEFEQLIQALAKALLGLGLEAWGGRGDWGRDMYFEGSLRYPAREEETGCFVFQVKFVEGANAAGAKPDKLLAASVRKECAKIKENLRSGRWKEPPTFYSVFTNAPVSAPLREALVAAMKEVLPKASCIVHDGNDVCQWLRLSPEIVRSFPQLLSLRDLQEFLRDTVNADVIVRSTSAIALAQAHSRVFVPTQAYYSARDKLNEFGFVVLEGPPEMGKTTIGRVIALTQIVLGWEALECRNPTDILKCYRKDLLQVFIADDFFGRTEYEPMRVSDWQSELPHIIPLLDHSHWLILTCRAHLLEMAKSNLDVAGQNHRFPKLGEVVVNAGQLKIGEKARILYRHAKAIGLSIDAKSLVRAHAGLVVKNEHFTPERVRRLVEEIVPELAQKAVSAQEAKQRVEEALANPTKQMRISFRKLPASHRWLLYSLLESDGLRTSLVFRVGFSCELQKEYEALCPIADQQLFSRVLNELTEGFVKRSPGLFQTEIDWIHPSCRDLAIEELAASPADRQRFLQNCSEAGLFLASSLAGGQSGDRQLPLLQTSVDWADFTARARVVAKENGTVLKLIWRNYQQLLKSSDTSPGLKPFVALMRGALKEVLDQLTAQAIAARAYSNPEGFEILMEVCRELAVTPTVDLTDAWEDCLEDVSNWAKGHYSPWEDDRVPGDVSKFIKMLQEVQPTELEKPTAREKMGQVMAALIERGEEESNSYYQGPEDNDERSKRADGYETLGKAFDALSELPFLSEETLGGLSSAAAHFSSEAQSLREELPGEPEYDGESRYGSSAAEDINVDELFKDL